MYAVRSDPVLGERQVNRRADDGCSGRRWTDRRGAQHGVFGFSTEVARAVATGGRLTPRRVGPFLNRFDYTPRPSVF